MPNLVNPYGYIYLITCKNNGKVYVGQALASRGIRRRWASHLAAANKGTNKGLYAAMRKHGCDNFDVREIGRATDRKALDNLEAVYIVLFNSMDRDFGYNRRAGGHSSTFSQESRKLMSQSAKKRVIPAEVRLKMAISNTGKPRHSQEFKDRLSQRMVGNTHGVGFRTEETKQKMRKPKSAEHRLKIAAHLESVRRVWQVGDRRDSAGRFVSVS